MLKVKLSNYIESPAFFLVKHCTLKTVEDIVERQKCVKVSEKVILQITCVVIY